MIRLGKNKRVAAALVGTLIAVLGAVSLAGAVGTPTASPLVWSGLVTDGNGKPYDKSVEVSVAFYDGLAVATPKCQSPTVNAEAATGRFSVELPDSCAKAVHDSPDLWSETIVGSAKVKLPRVKVSAVPFALEAAVASQAGGALASELDGINVKVGSLEKAVTGLQAGSGVESQQIKVKDANGTIVGTVAYGYAGNYTILTSTKMLWHTKLAGPALSTVQFLFGASGCQGTKFADSSLLGKSTSTNSVLSYKKTDGFGFFRPKGPLGTTVETLLYGYASKVFVAADGTASGCQGFQPTTTDLYAIEDLTGKDVGLPANLAYPLTLVL